MTKKPKRNLGEVIEQLLAVIPPEEEGLIASLSSVLESAAFSPPEMIDDWWRRTMHILEEIGQPKSDWQLSVHSIWCDNDD